MKPRLLFGMTVLACVLFAPVPFSTDAQAQAFPAKLVKVIVPAASGGNADAAARGLAQRLSETWGQPVVIENRPGAGGTVGAAFVASAAPDGYTLLFAADGVFVITPHLYSNLSYHALTAFAPITVTFHTPSVLILSNAVPARTLKEFFAYARANPGKLSYGSYGYGSNAHVALEHLKQLARLDLVHVPYKGGSPALTDLIAGRVALLLGNYAYFEPYEKSGKLKIIAALGEKRLPERPELPTITESEVPGYTVGAWTAMAAPAGTPAPVLDRIHADVVKILRDPAFNEKFMKPQAFQPGGNSREEFASMLKAEYARWGQLVKATGAKVE